MKFKDSFHPYAMVTILFWSLTFVMTRLVSDVFSPYSLGFLRYFIASATLIVIALIMKPKLPDKKDIPIFFVSGAAGFGIYMILFNKGQSMLSAATGSVIIATVPVITAFLARFIYREKLKPYQWAAIIVEFAGVVILTIIKGGLSVNIGMAWMLGAAILLSIYNLIQRKLTKRYTGLQASMYSIFCGTLILCIFAPQAFRQCGSASPMQLIYILIMGVFSSAIAYVAWSKAFEKAEKASQVSNYMFVTPFLTTMLGLIMANEVPDRATIIGGGIILFGVMVFNFGGKIFSRNN